MKGAMALLWVAAWCARVGRAAEILVVLPQASHSHLRYNEALPRALAERGHNVTLVVPWAPRGNNSVFGSVIVVGDCTDAYDDILLSEWKQRGAWYLENLSDLLPGVVRNVVMWALFWKHGHMMVEHTLRHPAFRREVMDRDRHFDAVVVELLVQQDAFAGLAHRFDAPLIAVQPNVDHARVAAYMGGPTNPAYINDRFLPAAGHLDLWQRTNNAFLYLVLQLGENLIHFPTQQRLLREYFPDAPSLDDLLRSRLALAVYNDHPLLSYPTAMPPNVIHAPAIHIRPQPLPQRLQGLLDRATAGTVIFSLGSIMIASEMPVRVQAALLTAFGELEQTVVALWSGGEPASRVPTNVHLETAWIPQDDLLAHPNARLLVTSCGSTSVQEALWYGVPVLCMPRFGDQFTTQAVLEARGLGVGLASSRRTLPDIRRALRTLLQPDSRQRQAALRVSQLLHDETVRPLDAAVDAAERVIRWREGSHLRPAAADLRWHQLLLLDAILALAVAGLAPILLVATCCYRRHGAPMAATSPKKVE